MSSKRGVSVGTVLAHRAAGAAQKFASPRERTVVMISRGFWTYSILGGALILSWISGSAIRFRGPASLAVSDDTALYQNLSEITVQKQGRMSFDQDIQKLAAIAPRYKENLPAADLRLQAPMKRVAAQKYSPSRTVRR